MEFDDLHVKVCRLNCRGKLRMTRNSNNQFERNKEKNTHRSL